MKTGAAVAGFVPAHLLDTLQSWCTPTVLFLLLNVVIATIAVTSRMLGHNNDNEHNEDNPNGLRRNPSLLSRLSSISFSRRSHEQPDVVAWTEPQKAVAVEKVQAKTVAEKRRPPRTAQGGASGLSQRKKSGLGLGGPVRSKSDTTMLSDLQFPLPPPPPLPGKIRKSETFELSGSHTRAATLSPPPPTPPAYSEEEAPSTDEVNAKADDFINKFKQQLKLQRLESLMRYKRNP